MGTVNLKGFDANQVLRSVFDDSKNTLRVSIVDGSTGDAAGFEVIISHLNDSIRLGDGTNYITSSSIASKNAIDASVLNVVDIEDLDASKDNLAIHDSSGNELAVNANGSINVVNQANSNLIPQRKYAEIAAVPSGVETTILSHTTTLGLYTYVERINMSGDNVSKFNVKINGTPIDGFRTSWTKFNVEANYQGQMYLGLRLNPGETLTVTAIHNSSSPSDFNSLLQYIEV